MGSALHNWYDVIREFAAVEAAVVGLIVGLTGALLAYKAAMAKVRADKSLSDERRVACSMAVRAQIELVAYTMFRSLWRLSETTDTDAPQEWSYVLRPRLEENVRFARESIKTMTTLLVDVDPKSLPEIKSKLESLDSAVAHVEGMMESGRECQGSEDDMLRNLFDTAEDIGSQLQESLLAQNVDIAFRPRRLIARLATGADAAQAEIPSNAPTPTKSGVAV